MDGTRLIFTLLALVSFSANLAEGAATDHCAWSANTPSAQSKQLKVQIEKFQSLNRKEQSCPLGEGFDEVAHDLRLGALQALAIEGHTCTIPSEVDLAVKSPLFKAMRVQGLKLYAGQKTFQEAEFSPAAIFTHLSKMNCLAEVASDEPLKTGDLVVSKTAAVIIDSASDPYQLKPVLENERFIKLAVQMGDSPERICSDALTDPTQIKISVFDQGGRSALFPRYGKTSSSWVTAFTERGVQSCVKGLSEKIAMLNLRKVANSALTKSLAGAEKPSPSDGIKILRHRSDLGSCRVSHGEMPNFKDLDCVQFCDFSKTSVMESK